ncbi:hypothetical protein [Microbacterium sp. LWH11-1.2]|uniref:hypothetical protein n=1 Tax=Microbacterium sp. LWH11-1.2 TaxID=3135258 RepID=UPI003138DF45
MSDVARIIDSMSHWHPIFLTDEPEPGVWTMKAAHETAPFGRIELRRVPGAGVLRYKVTMGGDIIGWSNTLQHACEGLYKARLKRDDDIHNGPPNGRG